MRECEFPPTAQRHAGQLKRQTEIWHFKLFTIILTSFLYDLFYLYRVKNISGSLKEALLDAQQRQTHVGSKNVR